MIYGWNFTNTPIPAIFEGRFAKQVKRSAEFKAVHNPNHNCFGLETFAISETKFRLQGVCRTQEELVIMVMNADNGHRKTFVTPPRKIAGEMWYGVYCS